jgi:hypothetical protein
MMSLPSKGQTKITGAALTVFYGKPRGVILQTRLKMPIQAGLRPFAEDTGTVA